jgi:hypothetical protein
MTTSRDRAAFDALKGPAGLPDDWVRRYYHELEGSVAADVELAIIGDTKITSWPAQQLEVVMGQIELWDASWLLSEHQDQITSALRDFGRDYWMLTAPSIDQGINYLYTPDPRLQGYLEKALGASFDGSVGTTKRLWLRKEIIRELANV